MGLKTLKATLLERGQVYRVYYLMRSASYSRGIGWFLVEERQDFNCYNFNRFSFILAYNEFKDYHVTNRQFRLHNATIELIDVKDIV